MPCFLEDMDDIDEKEEQGKRVGIITEIENALQRNDFLIQYRKLILI